MAGSDEAPPTADQWRRVSKFYRRPLGFVWLIGLATIPLLLGAIGYGVSDRSLSWAPTPTGTVPTLSRPASSSAQPQPSPVPAITLAPASIVRSGNNITLSGDFPDQKAKAALVDAVTGSLPPGINVIEQLGINPDINALDFSDAGPVFNAAAPIADFQLTVKGDTITLAGTAATADQEDAVEQAAEDAWPNLNILDKMEIKGPVTSAQPPNPTAAPSPSASPSAPATDCGDLQRTVRSVLPQPIIFSSNDLSLTPEAKQKLTLVADKLKACPGAKVAINGYSDSTGSDAVNVALSANRAKAVADFLIANGVTRDHLTPKGLGSANPVASNDTPQGRAQNRRVEIVVS